MQYIPLTHTRRNGVTESIHYGAMAVVNVQGQLLYKAGDPKLLTFARSALKPFQALPFLNENGVQKLGLNLSHAAVVCASHSGEDRHANAVEQVLSSVGANYHHLQCGCHIPYRFTWFDKQPPSDATWNALHHNCSGKHASFIAAAQLQGLSTDDYLSSQHPVQIAAKQALAQCTDVAIEDLSSGVDGCSAPTYALPLQSLALGFARLSSTQDATPYTNGLNQAFTAMTQHPEMVSGEGRNDLALSLAGQGDWVCKIGAEAVQCIGIRSLGIGIALKISDGNMRGLFPATVALLDHLGILNESSRATLEPWRNPHTKNTAGIVTGDILPYHLP